MRTVRPMSHEGVYNEQILPLTQNASSYVRTVLFCQNALVRSGISHLLSGTHFFISEEPLQDPSELPILCLIHIDWATDEVPETVGRLKAQWPSARVVLLTDHMAQAALVQALQAGLDRLCSTTMSHMALIKALEFVMLGETFLSAAAALTLLQQGQTVPQARVEGSGVALIPANDFSSVSRLSDREAQILHFLTKGASNKLIARDLGVAEATIKVHIKAILRKVRVANRTQAAMWAQQHLNRVANDALIAATE
jgi:two-component system, NarL family, nitrate/nitrite response regulator NarL